MGGPKSLMKLCEALSEAGSIEQFLEVTLIWKKNSVQIGVSSHTLLYFCVYIYSLYIHNCIYSYMYSFMLIMTRKFCLIVHVLFLFMCVHMCIHK